MMTPSYKTKIIIQIYLLSFIMLGYIYKSHLYLKIQTHDISLPKKLKL